MIDRNLVLVVSLIGTVAVAAIGAIAVTEEPPPVAIGCPSSPP